MINEEHERSQRPPELMEGPFLEFELQTQIEILKREDPYRHHGRNSKTLIKYPDFRIVLTVMKAGDHIQQHKAAGRISVQTVSGHIRMHASNKLLDLPTGRLLVLDRVIPHEVEALEDSAFLLTIAAVAQ